MTIRHPLFILSTLFLLACDQAPQELEAIPRDQYAEAFARTMCDQQACAREGVQIDVEACVAYEAPDAEKELQEDLARGGTYDGVAAARCVRAWSALLSGDEATAKANGGYCNEAIATLPGPNWECVQDKVCGTGRYCAIDEGEVQGACAAIDQPHRAQLGGTCVGDEELKPWGEIYRTADSVTGPLCHSVDGLTCDSVTRTCVRLLEMGAVCDSTRPSCAAGLFCAGTCVALGADGQSCLSVACQHGSFCDEDSICRPGKPAGSECGIYSDDCADGLFCDSGICTSMIGGHLCTWMASLANK